MMMCIIVLGSKFKIISYTQKVLFIHIVARTNQPLAYKNNMQISNINICHGLCEYMQWRRGNLVRLQYPNATYRMGFNNWIFF